MTSLPRALPRALSATLAAAALLLTTAPWAGAVPVTDVAPLMAAAAVPNPPVPAGLPVGAETLASYVPANTCDPVSKPGVVRLGKLLTATYGGSYGIDRTCGTDLLATSEHYEGRALDWMHSVRVASDKAEVDTMLTWLFATDPAGNRYANARRLGVMYVIWNNRIWGAYSADAGWRDYNNCANRTSTSLDATCHRNHVHFSLSWAGAQARTSFWTRTVAAEDFGPCRPADLNWAATYRVANPRPCARYPKVAAPAGASATLRTLVQYSGMELTTGRTGPIVTTLQRVLGVGADGVFGSVTATAVRGYQSRHGLAVTGTVTADTWRALLKEQSAPGTTAVTPAPTPPPATSPLTPYKKLVLQQGSRGKAVTALQKVLKITADGWFGPQTRATVVRFQKAKHLKADGIVNADDWKALGA
ncbi:MAG: peptidoglycan-binding protein [Friedmanniella sp.]|nr:peptidoglycan-binding protein [Friedmanniella sp.]